MLPIAWGVFGPHPDESLPRCLLAPHTSRKRQIRSAPLARTRSSLSDAAADRIEVQYRNPLSRSSQNSAQQKNCRKTTHQDSMKTHCPPYGYPRPTTRPCCSKVTGRRQNFRTHLSDTSSPFSTMKASGVTMSGGEVACRLRLFYKDEPSNLIRSRLCPQLSRTHAKHLVFLKRITH